MRATVKRYYEDTDAIKCKAKIVKIHDSALELDQTIAYPEGGGQEGDQGRIHLCKNPSVTISFQDTQLSMATPVFIENYPGVKSGGIILHHISNKEQLNKFKVGDEVLIEIDIDRRKNMSLNHTAAHVVYWAVDMCRPGVVNHTIGCHIKTDSARLDFAVEDRFSQDDIQEIEKLSNQLIKAGHPIIMRSREDYYDVRYWECNGYVIPCGGTHVKNTKELSSLKLQRKNIGKGKERLIFSLRTNL
ncbi:Alanine--tRNA ligase [Oligella urethralis]|uniref:alanyl-tRNA editing protein n=1 Tax=Oligella urethralis TaxID=90245 RepID=UPI00254D6A8C|nr:alanyl-tRNA editing protein [Oligella urethralis]MDK6202921.1 alanyl-tRNA editing protein [Oligella urethralis]WOS36738.1 Alanine--tRNA ligase [Oligella urethralis]